VRQYSKSLLLIDDSPDDRFLFSRELTKRGFDVIATDSPEDAMAAIVAGRVGCLVADHIISVRRSEFAEVVKGVRNDIPIIVLSGAPYSREPLPPGAVFVSKQKPDELIKRVEDCMQRWALKRDTD
jgi:DNA-binding NtrC family response regulator